jgi:hypothetical protein
MKASMTALAQTNEVVLIVCSAVRAKDNVMKI